MLIRPVMRRNVCRQRPLNDGYPMKEPFYYGQAWKLFFPPPLVGLFAREASSPFCTIFFSLCASWAT